MGGEDKAEGVDAGAQGPPNEGQRAQRSSGYVKRLRQKPEKTDTLLACSKQRSPRTETPGPGGLLEPDHVWSIITSRVQQAARPHQCIYECPLAVCRRDPVRKARGTKGTHRVVRDPLKRSQERGFPRPRPRTMGLTGVGGRQQDGESKRTRTAPSVHVDKALKEAGKLRRGRIYVLCFELACLLTEDTQRRKRGKY